MTSKNQKITLLAVLGIALMSFPSLAQGLSEVNNAVKGQQAEVKEFIKTILTYLTYASLLFIVTNLLFNYTQSKAAWVSAIVILIIRGVFEII